MRTKRAMSVLMGLTMAIMAIGFATPARADERLVTTVPFDFIVGDARLPAGHYVVTEMSELGMLSIANTDGEHTALVLTIRAVFDRGVSQSGLVFERFEGQHFLARIVGENNEGREILLTPALMERAIQHVAALKD